MGLGLTSGRAPAARLKDGPSTGRIVAAFGLRGVGAVLTLVQNALLARVAGAGALGIYFVSHSWSRVAGTATAMGLPPYVLRESATLWHTGRVSDAEQLVRRSRRLATGTGAALVVSALVTFSALYVAGVIGWSVYVVAVSAAVGAAAYASTRLLADALKARGRGGAALMAEFALPALLVCSALVVVLAMGVQLTVGWMLFLVVAMVLVVPLLGWAWWDRQPLGAASGLRPGEAGRSAGAGSLGGRSFAPRSLARLTLLGGLNILLWTQPMLLMPFLVDDVEIGHFGVAHRVVAVASLNIVALGSYFAPRFATAYALRHGEQLYREARRAGVLALISYLPFLAVFVAWPGPILGLFGSGFEGGSSLLVIMALGQVVNAATGLCSEVLVMTGHEQWEVWSTAVAVATMFVFTLVAGAAFGANGVAFAFAGSVALRNAISYVLMRRVTREAQNVCN